MQLQQQVISSAMAEAALTSAKGGLQGAGAALEASPPQLAPEHLERVHRHRVSLTGGAHLKLITSQAIKQSSADNHFWISWI